MKRIYPLILLLASTVGCSKSDPNPAKQEPSVITVAGGNNQGDAANQFVFPQGIHVDAEGNVFVVDDWNDRVQKWALEQ